MTDERLVERASWFDEEQRLTHSSATPSHPRGKGLVLCYTPLTAEEDCA